MPTRKVAVLIAVLAGCAATAIADPWCLIRCRARYVGPPCVACMIAMCGEEPDPSLIMFCYQPPDGSGGDGESDGNTSPPGADAPRLGGNVGGPVIEGDGTGIDTGGIQHVGF